MILASSTKSKWNSIFRNAAGIIFLATPHRAPSSADGACFHIRSTILHLPIPPLIRLLHAKSLLLDQIADRFNSIWGPLPIFTFRETKAKFGFGIVIHHSTFLYHLFHQLLLSDCPQDRCDHILSRRADIWYLKLRSHLNMHAWLYQNLFFRKVSWCDTITSSSTWITWQAKTSSGSPPPDGIEGEWRSSDDGT